MSLETVIQAALYKISGGSPFGWKCYGPNARYLDFSTEKIDDAASVVFDTVNQTVYEITFLPEDGNPYRWINPEFLEAHISEAISRDIDYQHFLDDLYWIDCDLEIDIIEKINSFFLTGTYDSRIMINIELSEELQQVLIDLAAEKGISIDEYATEILIDVIEKKSSLA